MLTFHLQLDLPASNVIHTLFWFLMTSSQAGSAYQPTNSLMPFTFQNLFFSQIEFTVQNKIEVQYLWMIFQIHSPLQSDLLKLLINLHFYSTPSLKYMCSRWFVNSEHLPKSLVHIYYLQMRFQFCTDSRRKTIQLRCSGYFATKLFQPSTPMSRQDFQGNVVPLDTLQMMSLAYFASLDFSTLGWRVEMMLGRAWY